MKNIVLSGVVATLVLFSGCGEEPKVDTKPKQVKEQSEAQELGSVNTASDNAQVEAQDAAQSMQAIEDSLSSIYFGYDQFSIDTSMKKNITTAVALGKEKALAYNVKLEGNCDEWGSDEYNFALGLKRANAVKKAIVAEGIDEKRISMVSYGESNPVCRDKTQECWAKNRRVDFKLLP